MQEMKITPGVLRRNGFNTIKYLKKKKTQLLEGEGVVCSLGFQNGSQGSEDLSQLGTYHLGGCHLSCDFMNTLQ